MSKNILFGLSKWPSLLNNSIRDAYKGHFMLPMVYLGTTDRSKHWTIFYRSWTIIKLKCYLRYMICMEWVSAKWTQQLTACTNPSLGNRNVVISDQSTLELEHSRRSKKLKYCTYCVPLVLSPPVSVLTFFYKSSPWRLWPDWAIFESSYKKNTYLMTVRAVL